MQHFHKHLVGYLSFAKHPRIQILLKKEINQPVDFVTEQGVKGQVVFEMEQIQDVKLPITVKVKNAEAYLMLQRFVVFIDERHQHFEEATYRDLGFVKTLCEVQVEHLAEKGVILPDHILNVFLEVLFNQHEHAVSKRVWHLVLLLLAPEALEAILNLLIGLLRQVSLVVGEVFVLVGLGEFGGFDRLEFFFFINAARGRQVKPCHHKDQVVDNFGALAATDVKRRELLLPQALLLFISLRISDLFQAHVATGAALEADFLREEGMGWLFRVVAVVNHAML